MRKYFPVLIALGAVVLGAILISPSPSPSASPSDVATTQTAPIPAGLESFYTQKLDWSACNDTFQCTTLSVPLDYANPAGDAISLKVIRLRAKEPKAAILLNPGGPGGSGIDYVKAAEYVTTARLRKNFDIVGFDPRGVASSTPVECLTDKQTDELIAADGSPDNSSEIKHITDLMETLASECAAKSSPLYEHVDTVSAARDIDVLRAALGQPSLYWLGKSYGTFLGATYAELFPTNVGRMVLDGAIDPQLSNEKLSHGQALGFDNAIRRFIADCPNHDDCPLTGSVDDGYAAIQTFFDYLDGHPGHLADGREFTQAMAVTGVLGSLYDKVYGWSELRPALSDALNGDYELLAQSVDFYTSRDADGHYADNSNDAIVAVNCLDRSDRADVSQTEKLSAEWSVETPMFGAYLAWSNVGCAYWKAPATGVAHTISAAGAPAILVVGTTNDPATPYPWAQALASQLSSGVLLTFDGDGHTAYTSGSACIDAAVDEYFLTGKATAGVICNDGP